jgi:hypothetical protein
MLLFSCRILSLRTMVDLALLYSMHVCSQLIIFVSPNGKKKTKLYWLLAYNLLFFQAYGAKHVKKYFLTKFRSCRLANKYLVDR